MLHSVVVGYSNKSSDGTLWFARQSKTQWSTVINRDYYVALLEQTVLHSRGLNVSIIVCGICETLVFQKEESGPIRVFILVL